MMTAQDIWASFRLKLINDTFSEEDFTDETRFFFMSFLSGPESITRRMKYLSSPAQYFDIEMKATILLNCSDDVYRFDFIKKDGGYSLAFIECITLPVSDINSLPYYDFTPLCEKETHIDCDDTIMTFRSL